MRCFGTTTCRRGVGLVHACENPISKRNLVFKVFVEQHNTIWSFSLSITQYVAPALARPTDGGAGVHDVAHRNVAGRKAVFLHSDVVDIEYTKTVGLSCFIQLDGDAIAITRVVFKRNGILRVLTIVIYGIEVCYGGERSGILSYHHTHMDWRNVIGICFCIKRHFQMVHVFHRRQNGVLVLRVYYLAPYN